MYPPPPKSVQCFRELLKKRHDAAFKNFNWIKSISCLRALLLPLTEGNPHRREFVEQISNALHVLYTVTIRYDTIAKEESDSAALTNFVLSLSSITAENFNQLENVLGFKLSQLSIPGIILAISPYLTPQLAPVTITTVVPRLPEDMEKLLPITVREPKLFPKMLFFPKKRFSVTLELLFHNGKYIGYAFLSNGAEDFALYQDVKKFLSQTLYKIYMQEHKVNSHALVITDRAKLIRSIPIAPNPEAENHGHLQTQDIIDYLIDHLDEMCSLEKMAADFHLSKSHLARQIKALTGYTMQTLHELLKIEQAKDLIKSGSLRMNDIALRLGYTNPNYFSNVFKKVTGMSPIAWSERKRQ